MEIWSLKECDSAVIVGQRYSEVEDDYNFQNMKPLKSLYLSPLPRFSQATCCLTGTRSSVLYHLHEVDPNSGKGTLFFFPSSIYHIPIKIVLVPHRETRRHYK